MTTPVVLGIGGGTASGKTTAALALADALGDSCMLLVHDRYYRALPEEYRSEPPRWNFDHPDALDTARLVRDLDDLSSGRPARPPSYDFSRHAPMPESEWTTVQPRPVVVVEGILALSIPELARRYTHRVFVDAPADIRLSRRIRRDIAERGRTVDSVLDQYARAVRPMHLEHIEPQRAAADLVVDGMSPVQAIVAAIRGLIGR